MDTNKVKTTERTEKKNVCESLVHQRTMSCPDLSQWADLPCSTHAKNCLPRKIPSPTSYEKYLPPPVYAPEESIYLAMPLPRPLPKKAPRQPCSKEAAISKDLLYSMWISHQALENLQCTLEHPFLCNEEDEKKNEEKKKATRLGSLHQWMIEKPNNASIQERTEYYVTTYRDLVKADSGLGHWISHHGQKQPWKDVPKRQSPSQSYESRASLLERTRRCFGFLARSSPWSVPTPMAMDTYEERPASI
ncbi:hypothetical protein BDF14DRAFT_1163489 [Spinellus fusiger]|nr:hypothetical protein BDF14DRAFT_1163489 [Spinellus fusiger]